MPILRLVLAASLVSSCATSRETGSAPVAVRPADLDLLTGEAWRGSLTYRDYQTEQPVTIRSSLMVVRLPGDPPRWEERVGYEDEPHKNEASPLELTEGGVVLDGKRVIARDALPDGTIQVTTEARGEDDDRPALIRIVWELSPRRASRRKLVRFEGTEAFIERHRYEWTR